MRPLGFLLCAIVLGVFANSIIAADGTDHIRTVQTVHTEALADPKGDDATFVVQVVVGDMVRLSFPGKWTRPNDIPRSLKIEMDGDAVEKIGVVVVPVEKADDPRDDPTAHHADPVNTDLSCFVMAVKKGKTTLIITAVGGDGKDRPVKTVIIKVVELAAKKEPPSKDQAPKEKEAPIKEPLAKDAPQGSEKADPVKYMHVVHTDEKRLLDPTGPFRVESLVGDMIRLSFPGSRKHPNDMPRSLKIEIEGDAVENIGVIDVPVERAGNPKDDPPSHNVDGVKTDLSCFLKAMKTGKVKLKITPVGGDGKEQQSRPS